MAYRETNLHPKNNLSIDLKPNIVTGNIPDNAVTFSQLNQNLQNKIDSQSSQIDKNTADISSLREEIDNKTIPLFGKHRILVPKDSADTNILPCTPSDNGKVLSVVNGEAQWANVGGGSGGDDMNVLTVSDNTFTGFIEPDKINLIKVNDYISSIGTVLINGAMKMLFGFAPDMDSSGSLTGNLSVHILIQDADNSVYQSMVFRLLYYSHFITLFSSTLGSVNFNFVHNSLDKFTIDNLRHFLVDKSNTCSGYINNSGTTKIAQYIAEEAGGLTIRWFDPSDGSTGSTIVDNTFSISDNVSLVGD